MSSIIDTWIGVRTVEVNGESNRILKIVKSRRSSHSRQLSEFEITSEGVLLRDPYVSEGVVLTGSARLAGDVDLEVVDIHQDPQRVLDEDVVAVPTLLRKLPSPLRAAVGDMSREKLLVAIEWDGGG